jgi:hypothetical protein
MRPTVKANARKARDAAVKAIRARFEGWAPGHFANVSDLDGIEVLGERNGKPWNHLYRGVYASHALREAWVTWLASAATGGNGTPNSFIGEEEATDYLVRFADALEIMCTARPDIALCEQWLRNTPEGDHLQDWAVDHMRANWGTGIGVLEAAETMAETPEEGMDHEGFRDDFRPKEQAA